MDSTTIAMMAEMNELPTPDQHQSGSETDAGAPLLPFAFARRFGVVITDEEGPGRQLVVAYRSPPTLTTLAEIKRYAKRPVAPRSVSEEEFEALLTATYARDSSQAKQMVEDLGDELDLASLADSVPETEDLLEQEDDAPIIRLINALLAEALGPGPAFEGVGDIPGSRVINFEPSLTIAVDEDCRTQVRVSTETRTNAFQVRTGEFVEEQLSVYVTARQYGSLDAGVSYVDAIDRLAGLAQDVVDSCVVEQILRPLARTISLK